MSSRLSNRFHFPIIHFKDETDVPPLYPIMPCHAIPYKTIQQSTVPCYRLVLIWMSCKAHPCGCADGQPHPHPEVASSASGTKLHWRKSQFLEHVPKVVLVHSDGRRKVLLFIQMIYSCGEN